ncbi:hypothetical protein BC936DRAFT_140922 [Jimgerdemannia flammicorona]|uniref:Cation-transporting P-type ATPase C-terminal domain-containing protein n=1 Tax=Jimgerdemannia flammicorona TaxID=994334 RepID=A0A433A372_9FUNG|nr:hypothetical protein BC936DRAFT_140922 [Jimgerdemannia flammicorona]
MYSPPSVGRTEAYPYLHPKRPTASLVSKKVLTSLIGQIIFCSGFQGLIYILVRRQEWYEPPKSDPIEKNIECFENTVLFMLSCFQYILIAVVFGVGPPYRKAMWTNVNVLKNPSYLSSIFRSSLHRHHPTTRSPYRLDRPHPTRISR